MTLTLDSDKAKADVREFAESLRRSILARDEHERDIFVREVAKNYGVTPETLIQITG